MTHRGVIYFQLMIRPTLTAALLAAIVSIPATFAAVALYFFLILGESLSSQSVAAIFAIGLPMAMKACVLAGLLGCGLHFVRPKVPKGAFVAIAAVVAAATAAAFAAMYFAHSPHVSASAAEVILAATWSAAAALVASATRACNRPTN